MELAVVKEIYNGACGEEKLKERIVAVKYPEDCKDKAIAKAASSVPNPDDEEPRWSDTECEEDFYCYCVYPIYEGQEEPDYFGKPIYKTCYFWCPVEM